MDNSLSTYPKFPNIFDPRSLWVHQRTIENGPENNRSTLTLDMIMILPPLIVCSPPLGSGGGERFLGKFPPGGGTRFLKRQGGGQLQEGESRFPNHLVEELSKNQKLIHETSCFKQFRPIFRSKSQNLWRYAPFLSQIGCSPLYHGVNIAETTHTPRPRL